MAAILNWKAGMGVRHCVTDQRGFAIVMALILLLALTGLMLAILSMSALEPQISQNLVDSVSARMLADAGLDYGYNVLVTTANWSTVLAGATGATCSVGAQGVVLGTANSPLPGLTAANGTFTLRVRNDCQVNDNMRTGVAVESAANFAADTNAKLVLNATGTTNSASRSVSVVIFKVSLPPIVAALAFPGSATWDVLIGASFTIDGRDTKMTDKIGDPTGNNAALFGITTATWWNTWSIEDALGNHTPNDVWGKNESGAGTAHGAGAVTTNVSLTSQSVTDFVNRVKATADITINSSSASPYSVSGLGSTCASDPASSTCWGTDARPKIVYIKATLVDGSDESLRISGASAGTGILIVENGQVKITGDLTWHGPIIVTGKNAGLVYNGGGEMKIYGAAIINASQGTATIDLEDANKGKAKIAYSKEALDLVTTSLARRLTQLSTWREK